jgi:hypothetical protein
VDLTPDLISRQAADATATFLTAGYLTRSLADIEQRASVPDRGYLTRSLADIEQRASVPDRDARATIKYVGTRLRFTDEQQTTSSTTSSAPATAAPAESCRPLPASPRLRTTPTSPNKRTATVIASCGNRHPETPTARQVDGGLEVDAPA